MHIGRSLFVAAALSPTLRCRPPILCAPGLVAPGETFKKAVYTKADAAIATGLPDDDEEPPPVVALPYASPGLEESVELRAVRDAAIRTVEDIDPDGQESYGDWCRDAMRKEMIAALTGLRRLQTQVATAAAARIASTTTGQGEVRRGCRTCGGRRRT